MLIRPFQKNLMNLLAPEAPLPKAFQLRQCRMEFKLYRRAHHETTASLISRAPVLARWTTLLEHLNEAE